jgi:lysyl-tRNA synthetase class 1
VKYTKGCGHKGKAKIGDHKYKITWRLHWPAWKQVFGTSIEGAGMDHHTKGGSEDSCIEVTSQLMKKEHAIPFKFGFILFQGKKYSKSKGIGMGVSDLITLAPPEIIKYILLKPDLEENVDINPTADNLLKTMDDFQKAAELAKKERDSLNRHERKMAIAFELSAARLNWKAPFLDFLAYYQIYGDWKKVAELTGDVEGTEYIKPYVQGWIAKDFMPEDYRFKYQPKKAEGMAAKFLSSLSEDMDALAIHNAIFDFAKANNMEPKVLFAEVYKTLIGKERGPRLGKLIFAIGVKRVKQDTL